MSRILKAVSTRHKTRRLVMFLLGGGEEDSTIKLGGDCHVALRATRDDIRIGKSKQPLGILNEKEMLFWAASLRVIVTYRRNLPTKGEVSPRRMKCPEGPSPRNSENQDSCSISSFNIARTRS